MKNTDKDKTGNPSAEVKTSTYKNILRNSILDAITIDLSIDLIFHIGFTAASIWFPGAKAFTSTANKLALSTVAGMSSYMIRNTLRENDKSTLLGGAIGGAVKYAIKGQSWVIGAFNNATYEYLRPNIVANIKNRNALIGIIGTIEAVEGLIISALLQRQALGGILFGTALSGVAGALVAVSVYNDFSSLLLTSVSKWVHTVEKTEQTNGAVRAK